MSKWQDKSDFEINKAVAELRGLKTDNGYGVIDSTGNFVCYKVLDDKDIVEVRVNYCENWSDGGPVIVDNRISINPYDNNEFWFATTDTSFFVDDKNPLRAAMIVYLEMNNA